MCVGSLGGEGGLGGVWMPLVWVSVCMCGGVGVCVGPLGPVCVERKVGVCVWAGGSVHQTRGWWGGCVWPRWGAGVCMWRRWGGGGGCAPDLSSEGGVRPRWEAGVGMWRRRGVGEGTLQSPAALFTCAIGGCLPPWVCTVLQAALPLLLAAVPRAGNACTPLHLGPRGIP
jgi:hypothetical protein